VKKKTCDYLIQFTHRPMQIKFTLSVTRFDLSVCHHQALHIVQNINGNT